MQRKGGLTFLVAFLVVASCARAPETEPRAPETQERPLAAYAAQRLVVVPSGVVRATDSLDWVSGLGGARAVARRLDSAIAREFEARGLTARWIMPAELSRAFERNRAYATDPYQLVWEPVRSSRFKTGERYGEPLSSQLRTMIALHEEARHVLLPIELRFERDGPTGARAILRAALVDARTTEARWVGEARSDVASTAAAALDGAASRLANLFSAP